MPVIMLTSTALLLDSNIRNSVCTPAKLPCRRVVKCSIVIYHSIYLKICSKHLFHCFLSNYELFIRKSDS
jgi:hypothetical protein